jgi:Tfp pilus assembly protein PilE
MPAGEAMRQRGFTYLILLFIVAIMGVMLAASATVWHTLAQRRSCIPARNRPLL